MFTAGVRVACMGRLICAFPRNVKAWAGAWTTLGAAIALH
jgi:hypothetical protein